MSSPPGGGFHCVSYQVFNFCGCLGFYRPVLEFSGEKLHSGKKLHFRLGPHRYRYYS